MFGKKADDKIAKKQAEQEAKDKAAMEKFGVDFDSYTSDDIKEKNVASSLLLAYLRFTLLPPCICSNICRTGSSDGIAVS